MAGDAATKAASKVKPSDEQLAQIDHPADHNTWHDVPNLSADKLKNQFMSSIGRKAPASQGDLQDAAGAAGQAAHPDGSQDPVDAVAMASQDQQQGTSSGVDAQAGIQASISTLRDRAADNIPDEPKNKIRQAREKTMNYLSSKMPQERREQVIWRLKKMVVEIQGHPDCASIVT